MIYSHHTHTRLLISRSCQRQPQPHTIAKHCSRHSTRCFLLERTAFCRLHMHAGGSCMRAHGVATAYRQSLKITLVPGLSSAMHAVSGWPARCWLVQRMRTSLAGCRRSCLPRDGGPLTEHQRRVQRRVAQHQRDHARPDAPQLPTLGAPAQDARSAQYPRVTGHVAERTPIGSPCLLHFQSMSTKPGRASQIQPNTGP